MVEAEKDIIKFYWHLLIKIADGAFGHEINLNKVLVGEPPVAWKGITVREFLKKWWGNV